MAQRLAHHVHLRFERLLCGLTGWNTQAGREGSLSALRDYEMWDDLDRSGRPREVAVRLLGLFDQHGPEPFCALLADLRTKSEAAPERLAEIAALEKEFHSLRTRRRREPWGRPPYRGLAYFDREHAPIFFGRDAEVQALIRHITSTGQGRRFTVVVGASGSGKSSLVRAGLWARLAAGQVPELPGSERWLISAMKPYVMGSPTVSLRASLADALKSLDRDEDLAGGVESGSLFDLAEQLLPPRTGSPHDPRWLVILDQMEELFGAGAEGVSFLDRLLEGTQPRADGGQTPSRFHVLATLRADFFHRCLEHPPLKRAVSREGGQFLLSAPGRLALERMVSGPVEEVDLREPWILDPALPPAIAADAERQAGGLALMAFGLRELYDRCAATGRTLSLESYRGEAFGGLSGVIGRRAEATLAALGEGSEAVLWRVFADLVHIGQEDAPPTRRRERLRLQARLKVRQGRLQPRQIAPHDPLSTDRS